MPVDEFKTCRKCRHPFPLFVPSSGVALCPPCRKRDSGEPLSKSDLAFEAVHGFYSLREHGFRSRLDGLERLLHALGWPEENPVEKFRQLRHKFDRDGRKLVELTRKLDQIRQGHSPHSPQPTATVRALRTRVASLEREKHLLRRESANQTQTIRGLSAEVARLRLLVRSAADGITSSMFGRRSEGLNLPDGLTMNDLMKLVHPDRHDHSGDKAQIDRAAAAFKWLKTRR